MTIGADTYAGDLLATCGALNAGATLVGRYPRFDLGDLTRLHLDLVLLPSEPYAFSERDLSAVRQFFAGPIRFVDGELLTWYGPRIPLALETFRTVLR